MMSNERSLKLSKTLDDMWLDVDKKLKAVIDIKEVCHVQSIDKQKNTILQKTDSSQLPDDPG